MTVRIASPDDVELLESIFNAPDVYDHVTDDGYNGRPVTLEKGLWSCCTFLMIEDPMPIGFFMLVPQNSVTVEVHSAFYLKHRGEAAIKAARLAMDFVFRKTSTLKLVTQIPEGNLSAAMFSCAAGFHHEGRNKLSFLKNGRLLDQEVFGLTKADYERTLCQQQQQ